MSSTPATNRALGLAADGIILKQANALAVAETTFRLLTTGPRPLAVDGRTLAHGLPGRDIDLAELRHLLLARTATRALKDAVWAELVTRARSGDPAWTVGCVGVAMPGLKLVAARVIKNRPAWYIEAHIDDIVGELLTEFLTQLKRIDIHRPDIAARLMCWARKGALRIRSHERRDLPCDPATLPAAPVTSEATPESVLENAVRQGVITPLEASLICTTRLDRRTVPELARERGVPAHRLYRQRAAAETRLVNALHQGRISSNPAD
jgi:hypothetical protein